MSRAYSLADAVVDRINSLTTLELEVKAERVDEFNARPEDILKIAVEVTVGSVSAEMDQRGLDLDTTEILVRIVQRLEDDNTERHVDTFEGIVDAFRRWEPDQANLNELAGEAFIQPRSLREQNVFMAGIILSFGELVNA